MLRKGIFHFWSYASFWWYLTFPLMLLLELPHHLNWFVYHSGVFRIDKTSRSRRGTQRILAWHFSLHFYWPVGSSANDRSVFLNPPRILSNDFVNGRILGIEIHTSERYQHWRKLLQTSEEMIRSKYLETDTILILQVLQN